MTTVRPVLACEVQLITWGESPDMGPWLKLRLDDPAHLELFRGLDRYTKARPGERFDLLLARPAEESGAGAVPEVGPLPADAEQPAASPPSRQAHPYGQYARKLRLSGFQFAPAVWAAVGTDAEYLAWLRGQPCAVRDPYYGPCEGDVVAAHVRRIANGAGMGTKPKDFSAIPLCFGHHHQQHQQGESGIGGKDWCDAQRMDHVSRWAWERLRAALGVESIGDASPAAVRAWAERSGVAHLLPREYREAA